MDSRSDKLTPLRTMTKTVEGTCYNHVRLALNRVSNPLRVKLPDHRGLEMILNDKRWLCVDSLHNDLPIMAWTEFDTRQHREALHESVTCKLKIYHLHAGLIMGSSLDALVSVLQAQLADLANR